MTTRKLALVLAMVLACSTTLTACSSTTAPTDAPATTAASAATPDATEGGNQSATGYTYRTSDTNRVVTENGTFTADQAPTPVLITSIGQSADVAMLDALMKKIGDVDYVYNATASADEVKGYSTVILATGASSKGLGAAGISEDQEKARATEIIDVIESEGITTIVAHLGGAARRGPLSDTFNGMAIEVADYMLIIEEGNDDGLFTDAAASAGVPITLMASIADCLTPLTDLFG